MPRGLPQLVQPAIPPSADVLNLRAQWPSFTPRDSELMSLNAHREHFSSPLAPGDSNRQPVGPYHCLESPTQSGSPTLRRSPDRWGPHPPGAPGSDRDAQVTVCMVTFLKCCSRSNRQHFDTNWVNLSRLLPAVYTCTRWC